MMAMRNSVSGTYRKGDARQRCEIVENVKRNQLTCRVIVNHTSVF
jgi:hypothetical protein